nr:hypothetical protein [Tanacetum cinerariifolium]
MSIQDIKDLKQQYLDEMKIMINQNQIEDYRNERIDIHYKRECKIKIDELKKNFNGMSIEINKKKELQQLEQATNLRGDIDEIDAFLEIDVSTDIKDGYYNSKGDIIYLENLLTYDTIPSLLPEMFLDHDSKGLKDEPNDDDLKYMVKNFDLGIHEKFFSPTYVSLPFEDRHYLFFTYVI